MSNEELTLDKFFATEGGFLPEQVSRIEASDTLSALKKKLAAEARVKWPIAFGMILERLRDITNIKMLDIMTGAWKKYQVLLKYTDKEKYPPGESFLVPMAEHTIKSEHHPALEILVNGHKFDTIVLDISLSLALKGVMLKVQDARIMEVAIGSCTGKGTLKFKDLVIMQRETETVSFPGSIKLGDGIPIAPG